MAASTDPRALLEPIARVEGLRLTHGPGGWALECPDFAVAAGERVALAGPSGAGKTTLLRALAGLHPIAGGQAWAAGAPLKARGEAGRRRHRLRQVGVVFQRFGLLPHLDALENVLLPLRLGAGPLDGAARSRGRTLLAAVGLEAVAHRKPSALSVGEQQRVALCRALIHRPRLVLADEPTASLDPATAHRALDVLFAEVGAGGLLCVTHDPAQHARFDRVVTLRGAGPLGASR